MSLPRLLIALFLVLAFASPAPAAAEGPSLILVLDASGSMWGQVGGENKIVIARRVVGEILGELPADTRVGLIAYGHRRESDCSDVETLVPAGPLDRARLRAQVDGLTPRGKTPLTAALERAFEEARRTPGGATVVLVSDGLETCGGDPCAAARKARASGAGLVVHVVGFGIEEGDVSQLECTAQAGGGLYLAAADAAQLATAFRRVVEAPPELPGGRLEVGAQAEGAPIDALVRVRSANGREVAVGRTYAHGDTNPRIFSLPEGTYEIEVEAVGIESAVPQRFEGVEVREGSTVSRSADFGSGELAIEVTGNGKLSDAAVRVFAAGGSEVASGRTYTSERSNPRVFRLAPGTYDVLITSVQIANRPEHRLEGLVVTAGGRVERRQDLASGDLAVAARRGGELVDAVIQVFGASGDRSITSGRTYDSTDTNPRRFVLSPGKYRVEVRSIDLEGKPKRELMVEIKPGASIEVSAEF